MPNAPYSAKWFFELFPAKINAHRARLTTLHGLHRSLPAWYPWRNHCKFRITVIREGVVNMKRKGQFLVFAIAVLFTASALNATAGKKNEPDDPEEILEALGGIHFIEKMKVDDVGSVKVKDRKSGEETYFHVYSGYANEKYRVIIFDNTPRYLGYYETELEPTDYEEGAVLLDSGDGESFFKIRLTIKGPNDKVTIDGIPSKFVKNEKAAADKQAAEKAIPIADAAEDLQPEYREWTIRSGSKQQTFTAIYIKQAGSKVFLKEQKRGITRPFPINRLSKADQAYLKKFK